MKDWFLIWSDRLVAQGWTMKQCIKKTAVMCPDLFGAIDPNMPYKWTHSQDEAVQRAAGRKGYLNTAQSEHLAALMLGIIRAGVPLTTKVAKTIMERTLRGDGLV